MTLPEPNCIFQIPNLSDDLEIKCRLYFPKISASHANSLISGFTIFAHPYASLGGSYDDPVVQSVGALLLKEGFILCTFNFRGAAGSAGSTSWTGKSELGDYVSVCTFMHYLINEPEIEKYCVKTREKPLLILGGYSYGSMIASHLPSGGTIQQLQDSSREGSSDHEISLRADEIAGVLLGYIETQLHRGRSMHNPEESTMSPAAMREVMFGGYESDTASKRISKDLSRRSIDVEHVRQSFDKVKSKIHVKELINKRIPSESDSRPDTMETCKLKINPETAFLLVSPLLYPVSGFTTAFSRLTYERKGFPNITQTSRKASRNLIEDPTFAIFGDKDVFASARRLRKWCHELQEQPASRFSFREISGASHFWHEVGASEQLRTEVRRWLKSLLSTVMTKDNTKAAMAQKSFDSTLVH